MKPLSFVFELFMFNLITSKKISSFLELAKKTCHGEMLVPWKFKKKTCLPNFTRWWTQPRKRQGGGFMVLVRETEESKASKKKRPDQFLVGEFSTQWLDSVRMFIPFKAQFSSQCFF